MDIDNYDPADQLRQDIEAAIAEQEKGSDREPEPVEPIEREPAEGVEEPLDTGTERERDEKGRFKAKGEAAEEPAEPAEKPVEPKVESVAAEPAKVETRPPPGFSVASKAVWEDLPQSVRDDIAKRETDFESGFKRYSGLGKFAEDAERNGTTLQNAVTDYASIETALKQNFVGGVEYICQRLGVDPRALAQVMAQRYRIAAQQQSAGQAAPAAAQTFDPEAMMRQFQQIAQQTARAEADARVQEMKQEAAQAQIDSQIAAFRADPKHKFFENVRLTMGSLVQAGLANNLDDAYRQACKLNPEIEPLLVNEANGSRDKQTAAAVLKARNAAKAVGGSPSPGVSPDAKGRRTDLSLDDEIRAAVDAQTGQI